MVRTVPSYSNITKRYLLYVQEKSEILYYSNTGELLNKRSELIAKFRHANKYMFCNYKFNNQNRQKEPLPASQRHS